MSALADDEGAVPLLGRALAEEVERVLRPAMADAPRWEDDGHVPRSFFAEVGAAGLFRRRWADGPAGGLPVGVEIARYVSPHNMGVGVALSVHVEGYLHALHVFGRTAYLAALRDEALDGSVVGCIAVSEDGGGSDLGAVRTTAARTSATTWRLTGTKRFVTNGGGATHALVLAQASREARQQPTMFVVDLRAPGVVVERFHRKLGTHAADAAVIRFDVDVPHDAVVGPVGAGVAGVMRCLRYERLWIAAGVLSAARSALRLAIAFLRGRVQYGTAMFGLQALRHRAAAAEATLRASEAYLGRIVDCATRGRVADDEIAAVKFVAAATAGRVIDEALQLLGGRGYTAAFPVERLWRDVRLARIGGGTDEVMLEFIAAALDRGDAAAERELARYVQEDGGR